MSVGNSNTFLNAFCTSHRSSIPLSLPDQSIATYSLNGRCESFFLTLWNTQLWGNQVYMRDSAGRLKGGSERINQFTRMQKWGIKDHIFLIRVSAERHPLVRWGLEGVRSTPILGSLLTDLLHDLRWKSVYLVSWKRCNYKSSGFDIRLLNDLYQFNI
jgi:hypothetical protein